MGKQGTKTLFDAFVSNREIGFVKSGSTIVISTDQNMLNFFKRILVSQHKEYCSGGLLKNSNVVDFAGLETVKNSLLATQVASKTGFPMYIEETFAVDENAEGLKNVVSAIVESYRVNESNSFCHLENAPCAFINISLVLNNELKAKKHIYGTASAYEKEAELLSLIDESESEGQM